MVFVSRFYYIEQIKTGDKYECVGSLLVWFHNHFSRACLIFVLPNAISWLYVKNIFVSVVIAVWFIL